MRLIDADALIAQMKADAEQMEEPIAKMFTYAAINDVKHAPTIEPEQKWIPCSDVPDTDRNVLIARGRQNNMTVCIGHYNHKYQQWYEDRNWFAQCLYDGLYWCEIPSLPEPYGGELE